MRIARTKVIARRIVFGIFRATIMERQCFRQQQFGMLHAPNDSQVLLNRLLERLLFVRTRGIRRDLHQSRLRIERIECVEWIRVIAELRHDGVCIAKVNNVDGPLSQTSDLEFFRNRPTTKVRCGYRRWSGSVVNVRQGQLVFR